MGQRMKFPLAGTYDRECAIAVGSVTIGGAGAISSQTAQADSGFVVAKTAAEVGRYTITFDEKVADIFPLACEIIGDTDAAFAEAVGEPKGWRNKSAANRTIDVQLSRNDTSADAETTSGFVLSLAFVVVLA